MQKDDEVRIAEALPNYLSILRDKRKANYLGCKSVNASGALVNPERCEGDPDGLWRVHSEKMDEFRSLDFQGIQDIRYDRSLLRLKEEIARKMLEHCELCERRCGADRTRGEKGVCGVGGSGESKISTDFLHWGEEPELVPSYTIFFTGCTFKCVFCQNWSISQRPDKGTCIPPSELAGTIEKKARPKSPDSSDITVSKKILMFMGDGGTKARNVNWVGGDPTSNLAYILEVLNLTDANIPQVWNSNMYLTEEAMNLLDGVMDVYLTDFKYGNDKCAERLSKVKNYWEVATRNHLLARKQCEVIIRHLVLPNHMDCCTKPIMDWIADNLENVRVNVMAQYRPEYKAHRYEDLHKPLSLQEFHDAHSYARELGLDLV